MTLVIRISSFIDARQVQFSVPKMNSKILQEKVHQLEEDAIEMRLLKRSEKNHEIIEEKGKEAVPESITPSTVSMKHYDQVNLFSILAIKSFIAHSTVNL